MQFSLSFFSSLADAYKGPLYAPFIESSTFADRHGFTAVWTPERHFHKFGGMFPNPSLMGVLLAMTTTRIRIRAGSVVLPLHHPVRVAEEWSVVDNLSGGRVDISFAVGWNPIDFVLAPDHHVHRDQITFDGIEIIRNLWKGESYQSTNGIGEPASIQIHPKPVQKDLNVWMTCTGRPQRFIQAGEKGFHVLTALIFQPLDQLAERIAQYRSARQAHGLNPETGHVTLMLHTFLGTSTDSVRRVVHDPLMQYLESCIELWRYDNKALDKLSERPDALEFAFHRYFSSSGLFGTLEDAAKRIVQLKSIGVNEIACLIDFGVSQDQVMRSLNLLNQLRENCSD